MRMTQPNTALITGASSGIGASFARLLAVRGYDLILVARRIERLEALSAEIEERSAVKVEILPADLATLDGIESVEKRIESTQRLQILINNAGFGTSRYLIETAAEEETAMINLHMLASVRLIKAALPEMICKRSGGIINVASISAFLPTPGSATYAASKAYLVTFSRALHKEVQQFNVRVQALCPGFTTTEFHSSETFTEKINRSRTPKFLWMTADDVAKLSLQALKTKRVVFIPGIKNRILVALWRMIPSTFLAGMKEFAFKRRSNN
jgi:uncharacterized protein